VIFDANRISETVRDRPTVTYGTLIGIKVVGARLNGIIFDDLE